MAFELCPLCRQIRGMRISLSERTEKGKRGKTKKIQSRTFHCEACHQFVRSKEVEIVEPLKTLALTCAEQSRSSLSKRLKPEK